MALILRTVFWVPRNFQWGILICGTMSNWGNLPTAIVQSVSQKAPFEPATDTVRHRARSPFPNPPPPPRGYPSLPPLAPGPLLLSVADVVARAGVQRPLPCLMTGPRRRFCQHLHRHLQRPSPLPPGLHPRLSHTPSPPLFLQC